MRSMTCVNSYWTGLAQCYALLGPPLRPSNEDVRLMQAAVMEQAASQPRAMNALLLGVTPDIVRMQWPAECALFAMDGSWPIVQALWPHDPPEQRHAVCADWQALPLRSASCDVVIGDGSLIAMSYPHGWDNAARTLHSVLNKHGILILRCYLQPAIQESPAEVFDELLRGTIASFHHFKLRLLMSMQRNSQTGVAVSDVYDRWRRQHLDRSKLPARSGWEAPVVDMIEHYRDSDTVYWFPTLAEFRCSMGDYFDEVSLTVPATELGERCPIVILNPRRLTGA